MTTIASPHAPSSPRSRGQFLRTAESVLLILILSLTLLGAAVAAVIAGHIDTSSVPYLQLYQSLLGG